MFRRLWVMGLVALLVLLSVTTPTLVGATEPLPPPLGRPDGVGPQSVTDGENVLWMDNASIVGVKLQMSAGRNIDIHNTAAPFNFFYVHTMRPPNSACIEVVVYHWRDEGSPTIMRNRLGLVPWCGGLNSPTYYATMDGTFATNYLRVAAWHNYAIDRNVYYNDEKFLVKVSKLSTGTNCWQASLWNYTTGAWVVFGSPTSVCGTPNDPVPGDGWTSIEEHLKSNTVCGNLGTYHVTESRAMEVQTTVGGSWSDLWWGDVTFTDLGATRCDPAPWHEQHVDVYQQQGYVLCVPAVNGNCD